jgi:DNA-binding PadR family transcriptional regulator
MEKSRGQRILEHIHKGRQPFDTDPQWVMDTVRNLESNGFVTFGNILPTYLGYKLTPLGRKALDEGWL